MHTILSQIQLERDGETIPRSTVRECIDILLRLSTLPPTAPAAGSGGAFGAASAASANRAAAMTAAAAAAGNAAHTVYAAEFEPRFLRKSAEFYEEEAEEGVERGDAAGYLRNVRPSSCYPGSRGIS
jgi:cullin 3